MKKELKHNARRSLLIDKFITPDKAFGQYPTVFQCTVATLDDEDGKPRNWSKPYSFNRIAGDTGGFRINAFIADDGRILSSVNAPQVCSSNADEYADVAKALKAMEARETKLRETLGCPQNALDKLIRQILCLNVAEVYERHEGDEHLTMMNKGPWIARPIGDLANRLHRAYAGCVNSSAA